LASEIPADDQNVRRAATVIGAIAQVRCTRVNEKTNFVTWILETTVASQKVKNGAILSHPCEGPHKT
jgi:hypothetical protein